MKKITGFLLSFILLLTCTLSTYASELLNTSTETEAYALNSFSGEQLGTVSNLNITQTNISFDYSGDSFFFPIQEIDIDTSDGNNITGATFYSGDSGDLTCNVIEYNDSYCLQILDSSESMYSREADSDNNFTVIAGENAKENISEAAANLKVQDQANKERSNVSARSTRLHVYVSGVTVPFLLSGGSAEGWCTATDIGGNNCRVSSLSYTVAYNWPSDGVSLWYDYMNSKSAYLTPAWPSSALTNVSGTWTINKIEGAFMAEATVSALVKGFPLMWTLYDVSYMDGTHQ